MAVFLPRRWRRQPQGPVVLVPRLQDTIRFGFSGFGNEWCPEDVNKATVTGTAIANDGGLLVRQLATSPDGSNSVYWPTSTRFDPPSSGFTLATVVRRNATAGVIYCRIFTRDVQSSPITGSFGFFLTTNSDKGGAPYGYVYNSNVGYTAATALSATEYERLVLTHDGTNARMWRNGALIETVAVTLPPSASLGMRAGGDGSNTAAVNIEMGFLDGRCWGADEIVQWSADRYSIFQPRPSRIISFAAPSAAGVTGSLSVTLDSLTSSSAGSVTLDGALGATLGSLTSSSAGSVSVNAALSVTLADATLSSASTIGSDSRNGTLSVTLGALTSSSAASVSVNGALAVTLDALAVSSASWQGSRTADLSVTLDALTSSGSATSGSGPAVVAPSGGGGPDKKKRKRRILVEIDGRNVEVDSEEEALALLTRKKKQVEKVVAKKVRQGKKLPPPPKVEVTAPKAANLQAEVASFLAEIDRIMQQAQAKLDQAEQDEEEALITLLLD